MSLSIGPPEAVSQPGGADVGPATLIVSKFQTAGIRWEESHRRLAAASVRGPRLAEAFAAGDFRTLRGWLGEHVHRHGQRFPVATILERATESAPDPAALVASLSRRYRSPG